MNFKFSIDESRSSNQATWKSSEHETSAKILTLTGFGAFVLVYLSLGTVAKWNDFASIQAFHLFHVVLLDEVEVGDLLVLVIERTSGSGNPAHEIFELDKLIVDSLMARQRCQRVVHNLVRVQMLVDLYKSAT